ncbi:MAG: sulfotransferase [Pseudomonadota bacterium]
MTQNETVGDHAETVANDSGRAPRARVDRAILLNCFGRGGSSIAWNMIGSSPDVLMPASEWHHGFYGRWQIVGRSLRRVVRATQADVPALAPLSGLLYKRACASVPATERDAKPGASSVVLKVMDHHIAMNPTLATSFPSTSQVVLVRHPLAQCESLLRHGLDIGQATAWYVDVMRRMIRLAETPGTIVCRFDNLVRDPFAERDFLYDKLGLTRPQPDGFALKRKKFGAERTTDVKVAAGDYVDVTPGNVAELIDKDVNERSIARLSDSNKEHVWKATDEVASYFGYN